MKRSQLLLLIVVLLIAPCLLNGSNLSSVNILSADSRAGGTAEGDNLVYLPVVSVPPPMINGDFELGPYGWSQYSSNGWSLVLSADFLLVKPHSGSWAAWLGGDDNEDSLLGQTVKVPGTDPTLNYYIWIGSEDSCGDDIGGVMINQTEVVDAYWLCTDNSTGGWLQRTVDLTAYSGQHVEVLFAAFTNAKFNSNLFIDDVSLGPVTLTSGRDESLDDSGISSLTKPKQDSPAESMIQATNRPAAIRATDTLNQELRALLQNES